MPMKQYSWWLWQVQYGLTGTPVLAPYVLGDICYWPLRWRSFTSICATDPLGIGVSAPNSDYFAVGMTNSAPLPMLSGQRCMMDFCLV